MNKIEVVEAMAVAGVVFTLSGIILSLCGVRVGDVVGVVGGVWLILSLLTYATSVGRY